MIRFFIDTDSDIKTDIYNTLQTKPEIIRLPYFLNDTEYYDDIDGGYNYEEFFTHMQDGTYNVKTAGLNSEDWKTIFEPAIKEGHEIFYLSFGTNFSGHFAYLDVAISELKNKYPDMKFTRYDSKAISVATTLEIIAADKALSAGKTIQETIKILDELSPKINIELIVDNLQHLKRGGRISNAAAFFGTLLNVKPIVNLTLEGKLEPKDKIIGWNKAIKALMQKTIERAEKNSQHMVFVMHALKDMEAEYYANQLQLARPDLTVKTFKIGPVVGAHCGPGVIAFVYVGEKRPNSQETSNE